jgi:hypothetical protein
MVHDGAQLLRLVEVLAGVGHLLDDPGEELLAVRLGVHFVQELVHGWDTGGHLELKAKVAEELDQLRAGAGASQAEAWHRACEQAAAADDREPKLPTK